ncbi:MAG: UDP-glucose 4-epimerase [Chloroflexi bacterium]|jgi:UDP-glucose 4-epimerase|nr:UDP-glucose 4-epimerase [Chloroflexota bacterium]MEA2618163.1 UDP-glucose 4-epimerase [Chloroflexota bacterium]
MRTLVTGGAGFIGSTLVDALLAAGHEVTVLDDLSRGRREQVAAGARLVVADVAAPAACEALLAARPEVVFHEAAQIDVRRSVAEPLFDTTVNVLGTVNLLQACVDAGVRRVVFASSGGAIYGDTEVIPTPETHAANPASHYGAAKQCGEAYGGVYRLLYGLEFVALRYANVYGPRQDPHGEAGVVAIFAERLLAGRPATINGDGGQTRDYVHVDDVVAANLLAMETPHPGAYNVATSVETDVSTLFGHIARACGIDAAPLHGPAKPGEQRRSCLDVRLAAERLGWRPRVDLAEGLANTVEHFRQARGKAVSDEGADGLGEAPQELGASAPRA